MSCSDVQTIKAGNGSQLTFSFDFPYIFKSEIHVYFWNATTKEYDEKLTTDSTYPWRITDANPTIVEFTSTAPPAPTTPSDPGEPTVDNVKIRRITKVDDIRALFNPGSAIRSDDLNKNFEQLRYAIQESNCQGIPDDVDQYLKDYYWDRYDNTLYDGDTWVSDDTKIATTAALDARFQDEVNDTFTKAELAAASNIMPDDDVAVPTTGALDNYINEVITNDIGSSDGVTITDDGDGTITVGLADNSVDFDKIKDADQIQLADQIADPDAEGTDNNIFTAKAATRRFNNYYQNEAPTATDGIGEGQVWVDANDDLTLSVWSGSAWVGITSGGTFTNQPKVVYVDASSGDDNNDGHRISRPKQSIKAAVTQINADDTHGNGSIVVVAPGVYQEACPIQIQKRDVAIVGTSVRNCVVHPTPATETATMFEVNSGTYLKNLTFTGMKASGTRGASGSLWEDATHGLPPTQGWNVAFFDDAMIYKSPYVQNCTNFSDSEIDNSDLDFYAGDENKGRAGDLDSAPTGGGLLVDGSTPHADSPLRSIVCDSYTHTGLDAPGIFVTNNGYMQATSSYAFFNHAHITCINGGQANLAASTTDFGRFGLIASGKSTSAIFTSTIDGAVSDGAISFNIDAPTAASGWHGSATRPQGNMLVTVNSVTYPILSSTANGSGWTVTISRPNSSNRSENLGVNGAISDGAAVSFFLRSMIASSGHTMEYVGSGTDYRALPGNGGVPVDANQKIELDNGKIWTATTDQNGKFTIGGNQTDDPFFEVDQQLGFVTIPEGSIAFNLLSDETPQLGGNLDVNGQEIVTDAGNENIVLNPHGTGAVNVSTSKIINVTDPTDDQDAATKKYVDDTVAGIDEVLEDTTPQLGGDLDVNGKKIVSVSNGDIEIEPNGTGNIVLDGDVGIGTSSPSATLHANSGTTDVVADFESTDANAWIQIRDDSTTDTAVMVGAVGDDMRLRAGSNERVRIDSSGRLLVGTTSAVDSGATSSLQVVNTSTAIIALGRDDSSISAGNDLGAIRFYGNDGGSYQMCAEVIAEADGDHANNDKPSRLVFSTTADSGSSPTERMRIDSSGDVQARRARSNTTGDVALSVQPSDSTIHYGLRVDSTNNSLNLDRASGTAANLLTIDSSGNVGIGTTAPTSYANSQATLVIEDDTNPAICWSDTGQTRDWWAVANGSNLSFNYADGGGSGSASNITNALSMTNSGNVGIGTTSPGTQLHVNGSTPTMRVSHGSTQIVEIKADTAASILRTTTNHPLLFGTNDTERMRIDSDGKLLVGLSSSVDSSKVQVNFSATLNRGSNATGFGNNIGVLKFADARANSIYGEIRCLADGTPGTDDYPGRLTFSTTSDGASTTTERMRIDSSGRVGIGTTSADSNTRLHVSAAENTSDPMATNASIVIANTQNASNNEAAALKFNLGNTNTASISAHYDSFNAGVNSSLRFYTQKQSAFNNPAERMRITNNGRLDVFANSSTDAHFISTAASAGTAIQLIKGMHSASSIASGTQCILIHTNGNIQNSNGSYGSISDVKLKENIVDANSQWDDIKRIQVRNYNFKEETGHETHTQLGVVAQEVETVSPGLVYETPDRETVQVPVLDENGEAVLDENGEAKLTAEDRDLGTVTKSVNYSVLYMKAVKALQEAMDRIETLEAKVAALEAG